MCTPSIAMKLSLLLCTIFFACALSRETRVDRLVDEHLLQENVVFQFAPHQMKTVKMDYRDVQPIKLTKGNKVKIQLKRVGPAKEHHGYIKYRVRLDNLEYKYKYYAHIKGRRFKGEVQGHIKDVEYKVKWNRPKSLEADLVKGGKISVHFIGHKPKHDEDDLRRAIRAGVRKNIKQHLIVK